jgi:hypothetical protein
MDKNHPFMRLADGNVVALPQAPDLAEFQLAGNFKVFPGVVALYDETTHTGATYTGGIWYLQQPVTRAQFASHCELFWRSVAAIDSAGSAPIDTAH